MSIPATSIGVKCGNCKHYHANAAAVRSCYMNAFNSDVTIPTVDQFREPPQATSAPAMSEKQRNFLTKLFTERGRDAVWISNRIQGLSMGQASDLIGATLQTPKATQVVEKITMPKVPGGRYAVVIDEVTKFFKVDTPTEGQWAGRTFLKIQASDAEYPVKNPTTKAQVLTLIAQDPKEAMLRYGRELGHCGHCGRTLTNEESRAAGIGPICSGKMGW